MNKIDSTKMKFSLKDIPNWGKDVGVRFFEHCDVSTNSVCIVFQFPAMKEIAMKNASVHFKHISLKDGFLI